MNESDKIITKRVFEKLEVISANLDGLGRISPTVALVLTCSNHADVVEFNNKFGIPIEQMPTLIARDLIVERSNFMREELAEFDEGVIENDLEKMADALVDLVYVALGTAVQLGLPWQALWNDVHRANMEKVPGVNPKRKLSHDMVKPHGWVGPKTGEILKEHGYEPRL